MLDEMVRMYRTMLLSRRVDDRQVQLKQQQKTFFQSAGAGHEAVLVAAGLALRPTDWFYPYYRDQALCLMLGMTARDLLLEAVGSREGPCSGGRQMPGFWGSARHHIVSQSGPTGMQFLQAVGCAEAGRFLGHHDEVVYVSSGEGATSEGEFWEALNTAVIRRLPVLFLIEDNGYAISVPVEVQTPGGSISQLLSSFPGLLVKTCDGTDPIESHAVIAEAAAHCRSGRGPALVHARVVRPYSHSGSDDERAYKTEQERAEEAGREPIACFRRVLLSQGIAEEQIRGIEDDVEREVLEATDYALGAPAPDAADTELFVYSPDPDPTGAAFDTEPEFSGEPKTMVDAINACLRDEMAANPRMVVFGQDVADVTRDQHIHVLKGKGGVFKATAGLQREFGTDRVFNSPLAEANIVGRAIGMATRGLKPVVEIQFFDYIWTAMMQIRDELAVLRWRSNNMFQCPVVIRVPIGGYLTGSAVYHSQSGEVAFTHIPGLRVVIPATAQDACGLLRTAIRCDDPVLFLEPKHLYRQTYNRSPYPGPDYMIPFGHANCVRPGTDLTIITFGATVNRSVQASAVLEREDGASVEVLDLRSLSPYDWDAIEASVRKTSRALVVHEDWKSFGYGAEIAARIAEELFYDLDAPVRRVGARDVFCGYHPIVEDYTLPQTADIAAAARSVLQA
ncbi:MAG TPA: dehydrogenase E1 component subunit alpha/beta [Bryobacteraceae bacterium]|nr:dehydrogenase E1 component subunit alpha/beta [Bryobacteraceae bacterium]